MALDKKTLMSLFIAFIMIASVIGFAITFSQPTERLEYNNYAFVRTSQGFRTTIDNKLVSFSSFPKDLEDIPFADEAKTLWASSRVVWFSYDPNDFFATEIADEFFYVEEVLSSFDLLYVQRGLVNNTNYVLPEITCANATPSVPVILFIAGNETTITMSNQCIVATAVRSAEVYEAGDRLLYQALGVMH